MNLFLGQYEHKIDSKGRVFVPRRILEGIAEPADRDRFVITLGLDPCLYLFTRAGFLAHMTRLTQAAFDSPELRRAVRGMGSRTVELGLDAQSRVLVPEDLRSRLGLSGEVTIVGAYDHFEIWDREEWVERESSASEAVYLDQASDLFSNRSGSQGGES